VILIVFPVEVMVGEVDLLWVLCGWVSAPLSLSHLFRSKIPKGSRLFFLSSSCGSSNRRVQGQLMQTVPLSMDNLRNFWVWTRGANGSVVNGVLAGVLLEFLLDFEIFSWKVFLLGFCWYFESVLLVL
jgi:hypothetical protein